MLVPVSFEISQMEIPLLKEFLKKHKVEKIKIGEENSMENLNAYQEKMVKIGQSEIEKGLFSTNEKVMENARKWLQSKK